MSQIIQQKVQVRNQKFDTVNGPLALYKGVSILPGGLRALTPIGGLPDGFIADTDVQGQFSIVFNTDALPFAGAVSGTQYYYDDTVAGGSIITTVGPKPLGIGVGGTTSEETGYIILNYKFQTQVPENVVPTPYASLALATAAATASPVTIIAEVVNAGNPSENGVYAIEPNGDTKKLDGAILANNGLNKDGNTIVLGQDVGEAGDPAKLLSNREIPTNGFNIEFNTSITANTSIRDNGSMQVGGDTLTLLGGATGEVVQLEVGKNGQEQNNTSVIQQATRGTSGTDGVVRNEILMSSGNPLGSSISEFNEVGYLNSSGSSVSSNTARGWRFELGTNDFRNLLGSSAQGKYYLGETGFRTNTSLSAENPPILSTATTEPMAIDIATGQIGRISNIYAVGLLNPATLLSTGTITSTIIVNNTRPCKAYFSYTQDVSNVLGTPLEYVNMELLVNGSVTFPSWTQSTIIPQDEDGIYGEYQIVRFGIIDIPVGNITIESKLYSANGTIFGQNQGVLSIFSI